MSVDTAFEQQIVEPFRLQAGSFTILVVTLEDINNPDFIPWLEKKAANTPYFLKDAPVVIDLGGAPDDIEDIIARIVMRLKVCGLVPVGVQNGSDQHYQSAAAIGLSNFPVWRTAPPRQAEVPPADEAQNAPKSEAQDATTNETQDAPESDSDTDGETQSREPLPRTLVIDEPVRSGRQIYAEGGDLVVMAKVGAGAEIRADGHIHIYGTLRGRAFAGAQGDTAARIFCRSFEAELVSIAGLWRVREDFDEELMGRPVQIHAENDTLIIAPDG
ncbi:MAG: septum site-determining protein MinC [Alphaproteobacteria bacterium]|nr:septum site-determining protein MinC [Alphaproteobacteria bacterium]